MIGIEQYSDDQLHTALRSYGLNVPITPTSRKVCENKLKRLMSEVDQVASQNVNNGNSDPFVTSQPAFNDDFTQSELNKSHVVSSANELYEQKELTPIVCFTFLKSILFV
jgi:hypothetical protein